MLILLDVLQIVGLVCGVLGAVLVTGRTPRTRAAGFGAWVVGNFAWLIWALVTLEAYLTVQFTVFLLLAQVGLWNNLGEI